MGISVYADRMLEYTLERVMIEKLHPTLKKCGCGFIGTKQQYQKHFDSELSATKKLGWSLKAFYQLHGEVPINQTEGDDWMNAKWLEGTPKGYND